MVSLRSDCGLEVVDHLFDALRLEEKACLMEDRGFTWWGEDLAQRIWAEPAARRNGTNVWKVHARSDFLADFVDTDEHLGWLTELAAHVSLGGALVRDENRRNRIQVESCLFVDKSNVEWAKLFFPTTATIQAAEAQLTAREFAALIGCSAAYSVHPSLGPGKRHFALDGLGSFVRNGRKQPVWTNDDFEEAAAEVSEIHPFPISVTRSGMTMKFPFGDLTALAEMTTAAPHASYGNGLRARLRLPIVVWQEDDRDVVLRCNSFELHSLPPVNHFTGSYNIEEEGFSYVHFIPNLPTFRVVPFLTSMMTLMVSRGTWFAENISGDDWPEVKYENRARKWLN